MKVSVVIPAHNRGDKLIDAVESVMNQTYKNLEIIIVSDGSMDNTEQVIEELKEKDSRIKGEAYTPNQGANYARNRGIELSTGDFVAFLDDDDQWYRDKIESQLKVFSEDDKIGLVYTGKKIIYVDENISYSSISHAEGDLSREILLRNHIGSTSSVMVQRDILIEAGRFDESLPAAQDYDLWVRICQLTKVGVVPSEKVKYFNRTGGNQISSNNEKYVKANEIIQKKYAHYFEKLTEDELRTKKMNGYLNSAQRSMRNGNKEEAIKNVKQAIRTKRTMKSMGYLVLARLPYKYVLKIRKNTNF